MSFQDKIWFTTLVGIAIVALGFLYVISQSGRPAAEPSAVQARAYGLRRWLFLVLIILGIEAMWATLHPFPIAPQRGPAGAPEVVEVTGHQWAWQLDDTPIHAGTPVEFAVTSADVNHGFGLYDDTDRLLVQTQAMPGVTNRLVYTFDRPGHYRILCLEYCGLAHHGMIRKFDVLPALESQP
ncbi:MAG: cytochrome oxidase [Gemmatimonadota bacterium]